MNGEKNKSLKSKKETSNKINDVEEIDDNKKISKKKKRKLEILNSKYKYDIESNVSLKIKDAHKYYGQKKVLNGVSFEIKKGEKVALIGKNGSGKSTLISIISQQTRMSKGSIEYGYAKNKIGSLEGMGIQFQTLQYPEGFIVKDVIRFFNISVNKNKRMSKSELSDIISLFGVEPYLNQKIDRLSGGQQQRINILLALIKKPKLLILDEISTGLDVESSEKIKIYIDDYLKTNKDVALLLISHSDEEIREIAEKVFVLEKGEIVEEFPSEKLTNSKFLEITSREIKYSEKQAEKISSKNKKIINSFTKSYGVKNGLKPGDIKDISKNNKLKDIFTNEIDNSRIDNKNIIEVSDLSKTYGGKVGAIRNLSLSIKDGERVSITGPNGSGKTTFVEIISFVKNYDLSSKKFSNLSKLSKYDLEREKVKNKQNLSIELRRLKNLYRIERENSLKQIDEFKKEEKNKLIDLQKEKKDLHIELNKDIASLKSNTDNLGKLKTTFKSNIKSLNEKIKKTKEEKNKLIDLQKEKKDLHIKLNKDIASLKSNTDDLEKLKKETSELKTTFKSNIKSLNEKIKKTKEEKNKLIIDLQKEKKDLHIELNKDIASLKSNTDDLKKLKKETLLELKTTKTTFKSNIKSLNEKIKKTKEEISENIKNESTRIHEETEKKVSKMKEDYLVTEEKLNLELKEKNTKEDVSYESIKEEIKLYKEEVKSNKKALKKDNKENILENKKAISELKDNFNKKVADIVDDGNRDELRQKLSKDIEDIKLIKEKSKLIKVGGYIDNGKEIKESKEISNSPTLMYSFAKTKRQVKDETGVQFQYASFPVEMSVKDVILFFSRTNKYSLSTEEMVEAIKVFKLEELLKRKAYKLSGGERQRLNVLLSIMKSPRILILDEISTGLDVDSIVKIDKFIKEYLDRTKATLILISHNYHEVYSLTNRIVVMKKGKLNEKVDITTWNLPKVKEKMKNIYKGGGI